ncbi:MAG: ketoacyl-ACP synthase III [Coprococcus sp.]|nr:ketoacyl-ACP synthase III [Coprococcus sp.]
MAIRIMGTGSFLAKKIVSNDELAQHVDTSDEWISTRTGIKNRRIAIDETTTSMAAEAAKNAISMAGKEAGDVELIIVATVTPDYYTPSVACQVQAELGADKAIAFDVNAACSGFVFALNVAKMYIETGFCKNALVIGAETLSKILDWNDRGTCVLFGDGAGAAYIEESDKGIISIVQGSIGKKGMVLHCADRKTNNIFINEPVETDYLHMDGQEVYKFAVRQCPKCLIEALEKAGMTADDIDYFVLHQANVRIIESVAKRLHAPIEKFPMTLDYTGNMSAASVPVMLDQLVREGGLKRGDKVAMSAFGAGLTYGAVVLEW